MDVPEALDLDLYYEDPDLEYVFEWHCHYTDDDPPEVQYHRHYGDMEHTHRTVDSDDLQVTDWGAAEYEDKPVIATDVGDRIEKMIGQERQAHHYQVQRLQRIHAQGDPELSPVTREWYEKYVPFGNAFKEEIVEPIRRR